MDNKSSSQIKPTFSPYQEGVKKALKQMGEQHTVEALQQGVPAEHIEQQAGISQQDILNQILNLSQVQMPAKPQANSGLMSGHVGLIGGLLNGIQGKGFSPMAQKTEPLGMTNAIALNGALQQGQKQPFEMQKLIGDIATQEQSYNQNQPEAKLAQLRAEEKVKRQESQATIDDTASINQSLNALSSISELLKGQPSGPVSGGIAQTLGKLTGGKSNTAGEVARQFTPAFSAQIYRDLTGDKRLSDTDAQVRAKALLPQQGETPILQRVKTDFMQEILTRRKLALERGEPGILDTSRLINDLKSRITESSKQSSSKIDNQSNNLPPELQVLAKGGAKITLIKKGSK